MKKVSTKNLELLPNGDDFQNLCKSISAIEAIICPEWEYRYFSYNKNWGDKEEVCEMRNGQGDQMLILFNQNGIVINGFAHESQMNGWKSEIVKKKSSFLSNLFKSKKTEKQLIQNIWKGVTKGLPKDFEEFIYGEPVKSIGTTFCIWQRDKSNNWQIGEVDFPIDDYGDGSADLLQLLDNNPKTYKIWAEEYYEEQFENFELDLKAVEAIYNHQKINKDIVGRINPEINNFEKLKSDLEEIGYENEI